ncbi:glutaredoxin family protein [Radiobacillus sp. PE A8.2]|uniref:glutaredoxin family protein n=1 Tax=Radiobacillus sp. PE A8.2 TaxID=3380349 RepID=UPI00388E6B8E
MKAIKITILSKENCHFCDTSKKIFNELANEYPLNVEVIDINTPQGEELASTSGFLFPPGLLFDNEPFSYGRPSKRKIVKEIKERMNNFT